MRFTAPGWIWVAALTSIAVIAIHLIAWRQPRTAILPTVRFVPDEPARRAARTIRLADLVLLALRVALVMCGGLAMARPVFGSRPAGSATVIAVASVVDSAARRDSIDGISRGSGHTSVVVFDTTAQVMSGDAALRESPRRVDHSLSVGLLSAIREARRLKTQYDTVRIAVVAPFTRSSFDNATAEVRALWPDSIRLIRMPMPDRTRDAGLVEFAATGDDPVVAGIRLAQATGLIRGRSRVVREGRAPAPDSGQSVLLWPSASPDGNGHVDAVYAGGITAIGQFTPVPMNDSGTVIAWWGNGAPAARESRQGFGCIRAVGFDAPEVGDFVLTPSFQRLAAQLLAPCGDMQTAELASDSILARLAELPNGSKATAQGSSESRNRMAAIIMVLATLLGLVELLVRRNSSPVMAGQGA
jgi:hypothetical protein